MPSEGTSGSRRPSTRTHRNGSASPSLREPADGFGPGDPGALLELCVPAVVRPRLWRDDLDRERSERTYTELFTNDYLGVWAISWMSEDHP